MGLSRILKHICCGPWMVKRYFPSSALESIEKAIRELEANHSGEIRFCVEHALDIMPLLRGVAARERAVQLFSDLRVWDTEQNNGVLLYLLLADHDIEVVADRGINAHVAQEDWDQVSHAIEESFRQGRFEDGIKDGLVKIGNLLAKHFPKGQKEQNELSDKPVVI